MRITRTSAAILALVAGLAFTSAVQAGEGMHDSKHHGMSSGQSGAMPQSGAMSGQQSGTMQVVTVDSMNLHSADQFIGMPVRDNAGKEIGTVNDLMINFQGERVSYAVVSGTDGRAYLVPLSAFTSGHQGDFVTLSTDQSTLATAPQPQPGMSEQEYGRRLHQHFGLGYVWSDLPGDVPVQQNEVPGSNLTYPGPRPVIPSDSATGGGTGTQTR